MPVFVQMLSFIAKIRFDEKKDARRVNEALKDLQEKGAKVLDVNVSLGVYNGAVAIYLITYEAPAPLELES